MTLIAYSDAYAYGKNPYVLVAPEGTEEARFLASLPGHWAVENSGAYWIPEFTTAYPGDGQPPRRDLLNPAWAALDQYLGQDPIAWARSQRQAKARA